MKNIFTEGWELRCEAQLLALTRNRKHVYICSPLRAADEDGILRNMRKAKGYMYYAAAVLGYAACAPHAFLPLFLCDDRENDRELALGFGLQVLNRCEAIFVCGDVISQGMAGEIAEAARLGIEIRVFNPSLSRRAENIVKEIGGEVRRIVVDVCNLPLASASPITCYMQNVLSLTQRAKEQQYAVSV